MGLFNREPAFRITNPSQKNKTLSEANSNDITNYSTLDTWGGWNKLSKQLKKNKDLDSQTMSKLMDKLYLAYRSNPIIFRASEIMPEFVCGDEGIQYHSDNKFVKQILDIHWLNPVNNWTLMQHDRLRDLGLFGELCIPVDVNPENGAVALGNIDTSLIDHVVYDPVVQMRPAAVILKSLQGEDYHRVYKVICEADVTILTNEIERGRLVGLKSDKVTGCGFRKGGVVPKEYLPDDVTPNRMYKWEGSCFYFSINNPLTSSRGLSDFTSILDWSELHDEYLYSSSGKAIRSGQSFVDITIKGATQAKIDEWVANNPEPEPGGRIVHNEAVEVQVITPDLKTEQIRELGELLKGQQLSGVGLAPHWFSEPSAARAVAPEMNEPTFKHFRQRQRTFAYILSYIFRFVIDSAIIHNRLRAPNDADFYIIFPQMSRKDHRMSGTALKDFAQSLKFAVEMDYLTPLEAHELYMSYSKLLSIEIGKDQVRLNEPEPKDIKFRDEPQSEIDKREQRRQARLGNQNGNNNGNPNSGNNPNNGDSNNSNDSNLSNNESVNRGEYKMQMDNIRIANQLKVKGFMIENTDMEGSGVYRFMANPNAYESMLFESIKDEYGE